MDLLGAVRGDLARRKSIPYRGREVLQFPTGDHMTGPVSTSGHDLTNLGLGTSVKPGSDMSVSADAQSARRVTMTGIGQRDRLRGQIQKHGSVALKQDAF